MGAGLRSIEPAKVAGGLGQQLLESARFCVEDDCDIVGYALVSLHADGRIANCGSLKVPDDSPINRYMFVGMVTEAVRERLIVSEEATHIVNRANGFDD